MAITLPSASDVRNIVRVGDALSDKTLLTREPQRQYMFDVEVFDTSSGHVSQGDLKTYVKSMAIPPRSKEMIMMEYMDIRIPFSGRESSAHTLSINFWDDESLTIIEYLEKWYNLTGDKQYGQSTGKQSHTKNIKVSLKDTTDIITTGTFTFYNCFPLEISSIGLSYENSDALEIPAIFSYDYVEFGGMEENIKNLQAALSTFGL